MADWADRLGLDPTETTRWLAAAWLHDSLKDAPEDELRGSLHGELRDLPEPVLHGPAAAERLRQEGIEDRELLVAIAYHTLGHPDFGPVGRALFAADFLEPGRRRRKRWRADLRARMPEDAPRVTRDILEARIKYLLHERRPVRPETMAFWNQMAEGEAWARASEV
jgi:HD superfamily phosphohydrolase YqeK